MRLRKKERKGNRELAHRFPVQAKRESMNGRFGHPTVPRNLRCAPWLDQGIVDDQPALPPVGGSATQLLKFAANA